MNKKQQKWNQWFAGLTDGDGCFYINKKEQSISFEITTHITDARVLYDIKNELKAGSVKIRSHSNSIRYRVKAKSVLIDIVNRLNGQLHNKKRLEQFSKVCQMLEIQELEPVKLDKENPYLAGLIDSDGTVTIAVSKSSFEDSQKTGVASRIIRLINSKAHNQLCLKVTSICDENVLLIKNCYGFGCFFEENENLKNKSPNKKYHWTIRTQSDFLCLFDYLKRYPLKSKKMHRIRLSLLYFKYKELQYHLKPIETLEFKIWQKFCKSWFKYSF
jgi:ubiquinol-cytochrome c reductase cytochrome b subunit